MNMMIWVAIFVGVVLTLTWIITFTVVFFMIDERANYLDAVPLEELSCEIIYDYKMDANQKQSSISGDLTNVFAILDKKWNQMVCNNPDSPYWRGTDWKWPDSIDGRIKEFNK